MCDAMTKRRKAPLTLSLFPGIGLREIYVGQLSI